MKKITWETIETIIFNVLFITTICSIFIIIAVSVTPEVEAANNTELETEPIIAYYNITEEERDLLAKLVFLEASVCSDECKRDVISVVFNRLDSNKWKKDMNGDNVITISDIVYYPNAFTPVLYGMIDTCIPDNDCYSAVDYVVLNGPTVPTYVRYFRDNYDFDWAGYENYKSVDDVYFGFFTNWQKGEW